ncbi:MAG: hypothetical protein ACFFG0_02825 [Candidatus Thorarchaeota archaeon]
MKTELQIAKENVKEWRKDIEDVGDEVIMKVCCLTHKQSCQRFLEYLVKKMSEFSYVIGYFDFTKDKHLEQLNTMRGQLEDYMEKIKDRQDTIKLYKENGI